MKKEIQNDPNINVFQNRIETLRSLAKDVNKMSDLIKRMILNLSAQSSCGNLSAMKPGVVTA